MKDFDSEIWTFLYISAVKSLPCSSWECSYDEQTKWEGITHIAS